MGGSMFFGLCAMLTGCKTFEEALELASKGNSEGVDMTVGDIYGCDYVTNLLNLPKGAVAASLGKMVKPEAREKAKPEDIARSLLVTITNNIGSIAYLHSRSKNINRIIFAGSFLSGNTICMRALAFAMNFWSSGKINALFLKHEGYAGAVGALLEALQTKRSSVAEMEESRLAVSL